MTYTAADLRKEAHQYGIDVTSYNLRKTADKELLASKISDAKTAEILRENRIEEANEEFDSVENKDIEDQRIIDMENAKREVLDREPTQTSFQEIAAIFDANNWGMTPNQEVEFHEKHWLVLPPISESETADLTGEECTGNICRATLPDIEAIEFSEADLENLSDLPDLVPAPIKSYSLHINQGKQFGDSADIRGNLVQNNFYASAYSDSWLRCELPEILPQSTPESLPVKPLQSIFDNIGKFQHYRAVSGFDPNRRYGTRVTKKLYRRAERFLNSLGLAIA